MIAILPREKAFENQEYYVSFIKNKLTNQTSCALFFHSWYAQEKIVGLFFFWNTFWLFYYFFFLHPIESTSWNPT